MGSDSVISTRDLCRDVRKNPTEAEALLWENLRNRQIFKLKFRRQYPIEGLFLDFYCPEVKLGVEIDGEIHLDNEQNKYDLERTRILKEKGISIIRIWNSEVVNALPGVISRILDFIKINRK